MPRIKVLIIHGETFVKSLQLLFTKEKLEMVLGVGHRSTYMHWTVSCVVLRVGGPGSPSLSEPLSQASLSQVQHLYMLKKTT